MENAVTKLNDNYQEILFNYRTYLFYDKQLSDNSVKSYVFDIQKYLLYLQVNNVTNIKMIKKENIINYIKFIEW